MKRFLIATTALCFFFSIYLSVHSFASASDSIIPTGIKVTRYDVGVDYMALMQNCVAEGTKNALSLGAIYEQQRNLKIVSEGAGYAQTQFFDCYDAAIIRERLELYNAARKRPHEIRTVYYSAEEVEMVAKVLYSECRGIGSVTQQACVAWVICNRVDAGYADTIMDVITRPNQFAYNSNSPVWDELYAIAEDVLERWNWEKNGDMDSGRVLPSDYLWFAGDGNLNYFRNAYIGGTRWDYNLPSPYET